MRSNALHLTVLVARRTKVFGRRAGNFKKTAFVLLTTVKFHYRIVLGA